MPSISPGTRATAWSAISCAILTACAPTTATVATDPPARLVACRAFVPVVWSARDSDDTIRQVKLHNAAHAALCGPGAAPGE